jgi:hypothetical protein
MKWKYLQGFAKDNCEKMVEGFSRLSNHCSSVVFSEGRLEGLPLRATFSPATH